MFSAYKGTDNLANWSKNEEDGSVTLVIKLTVSVKPENYPGDRLETSISVAMTCFPCRRVKPQLKKADFPPMSTELTNGDEDMTLQLFDITN